jgi:hypothetical protein
MGEGKARQGFPAPLFPFWEKGLGDEGKALVARVSGLMYTQEPTLGEEFRMRGYKSGISPTANVSIWLWVRLA